MKKREKNVQPPIQQGDNYQQPPPPQQGLPYQQPQPEKGNGLGIASLVMGIIAIIGSWVPLLNIISVYFGFIALGIGVAGLIIGIVKKRSKVLAIAGLILGIIAVIVSSAISVATLNTINEIVGSDSNDALVAEKEEIDETVSLPSFSVGETIVTEICEISVNSIEITDKLLAETDNVGVLDYGELNASEGMVYIHIDTDIKNLKTENLNLDLLSLLFDDDKYKQIPSASADYNNGYIYYSVLRAEGPYGISFDMPNVKPLETVHVHFLIECPEEVATSDNPLKIYIKVVDETFEYAMR